MKLMRRLLLIAVMAAIPIVASSASAATLSLDTVWFDDPEQLDTCGLNDYSPTGCYGWYEHYVTYAAGPERNNVTIGGEGTEVIVLRDPNVPISAGPQPLPDVGDPLAYLDGGYGTLVYRSWGCSSPQGRGNAVCAGTPGDSGLASFDKFTILLGGGDDQLTLLRGSIPTHVFTNSGNDTIDSRNNTIDRIACGAGVDTVLTDGADAIAADCENVERGLGLLK
jgi:hypothetical protein